VHPEIQHSRLANLIKYGFNGILVALSQYLAMTLLVESLGFASIPLQNAAYALSIEVSIIAGFFLHAFVSWRYRFHSVTNFAGRFLLFNLVTGISFTIKQGVFYGFSLLGMNYRLNTLIGIAIAVVINFFGYDSFVFSSKRKG
jgi:dolichol-phosphate mannosyltransferase